MRAFSRRVAALAAFLWVCSLPSRASATVLTFEPSLTGAAANQSYGQRVTAPVQPNGFRYGTEYGFTPNVTVVYEQGLRQWDTGYGDLVDVLFEDSDSGNWDLRIVLFADEGYEVTLHQFDLGVLAGASYSPDRIAVSDGLGNPLWEVFRPLIADTDPPSHTKFRFDPPIVGRTLQISIEFPSLGRKLRRIGIDNIGIGQTPSPGATILLACGAWTAAARRRSRPELSAR